MFKPVARNFTIYQGADFNQSFTLGIRNDAGYIVDFTDKTILGSFKEWYTAKLGYTLLGTGAANSTVTLIMDRNDTTEIPSGKYVYDVYSIDTGANVITKIMEGVLTISPSATFTST